MKKILYYVTDHGMGHATRTIAIIRELQKLDVKIILRNNHLQNFLKSSLPSITVIPGITDIGPIINDDGISIDINRTQIEVGKWIDNIIKKSDEEYERINRYSPDLIVSDISAMPFLVSNKLQIPSIAISNFSWYDVLDCITFTQHEILKEAYNNADLAIQLPLSTKMEHFKKRKKVGFVCRATTSTRKEIRKMIGLSESDFLVFFALGKSSNIISCKINQNVKVMSSGIEIMNHHVIQAPKTIEGQDLVFASDLVVCKLGYGIVSECITCGTPFLYLSSSNHNEQKAMSEELHKKGFENDISFEELNELNLTEEYIKTRKSFPREKIDTNSVIQCISEMFIH